MSQRRYTPARLRYLKARLLFLIRPSFLVGVVFLSAVGLVIQEYWTNPEFLKFSQNQEASPESSSNSQSLLSEEDRAIAADIDNLSVLDYDREQARIPVTTIISDRNKIRKQNEEQLNKILDLAKKNQKAKEIQSNIQSKTPSNSTISQQNPFLTQAENLLKFNFANQQQASKINNLSPIYSGIQASQSSLNNGVINSNLTNQIQNTSPTSALKAAIDRSNIQSQENPSATTPINKNIFEIPQNTIKVNPSALANQKLRPNPNNPLVDTTIFNQPLNNQQPTNNYNQRNLYNNFNINQQQNQNSNFNNNQLPADNYNQSYLNNSIQNPSSNINNNQQSRNNYIQPGLNKPIQNPSNFNNNQIPGTNYIQPNLQNNFNNNQMPNPYSNFNNNQIPGTNYNQPNLNNQVQNPSSNFNNTRIRASRYSPQIQQRIQNIYNKLNNRNNPNIVTPNTYNLPNNSINTGLQQPLTQQSTSPYSIQTPIQFPNNGYRY